MISLELTHSFIPLSYFNFTIDTDMRYFLANNLLFNGIKNFIVMSKDKKFTLIVQQGFCELQYSFDLGKSGQTISID